MGVSFAGATDPWRTRVCGVIPFAGACASARCRVVVILVEFLSSVIVDLCSRWTRYVRNVAQQLTLDEQFVDAAMPNVKRSLAMQ